MMEILINLNNHKKVNKEVKRLLKFIKLTKFNYNNKNKFQMILNKTNEMII